MDPKILEMLFIAVSNGVALFIGAYLARRIGRSQRGAAGRARGESGLQRQRREALLERLALQRRALDDYARMIVSGRRCLRPERRARGGGPRGGRESIAMYAQMANAYGSRQFAEQAAATLHAVRAGRGNVQVFPFAVQIASACYQEMIRAISELEKEIGLPAPRSPAPAVPPGRGAREGGDSAVLKERRGALRGSISAWSTRSWSASEVNPSSEETDSPR